MLTRPWPVPNLDDEAFWRGGGDEQLLVNRCRRCGHWFHPPRPVCPVCRNTEVGPEPTTGLGRVFTFTVNHQPWLEALPPPYVVAIVELDEQPGLRLTTNIVGCPLDAVRIGMPVAVTFERRGDVWLPMFQLAAAAESIAAVGP